MKKISRWVALIAALPLVVVPMTAPAEPRAPIPFSENARTVLARRYLLRDEAGALRETPEQLIERVATAIAEVEAPGERDRWAVAFFSPLRNVKLLQGWTEDSDDVAKAMQVLDAAILAEPDLVQERWRDWRIQPSP